MRIAIVQMTMGWTAEENTRAVVDHLALAKPLAPDVVLFPECAASGYHRQVPEQVSRRGIAASLRRIRAQCRRLELAAVVGTPLHPTPDDDVIWNAAVAIDARGALQAVCPKAGLTGSERRYFRAGTGRPCFTVGAARASVILCREVREAKELKPLIGGVDIVFWPGGITWNREGLGDPDDDVTPDIARSCARTLGSWLVQCNWPHSLNRPEITGMGGSVVLSPTGGLFHRCPEDEPGISLVEIPLG